MSTGETACLIHAALGHQKMEVHVEIDPVPKGLDGGDDRGPERRIRSRKRQQPLPPGQENGNGGELFRDSET